MSGSKDNAEVWIEGAWRPGTVVSLKGDGWARVRVDCYGKVRELTFSPRSLRIRPEAKEGDRG
jgi:hypothetical protein